MKVNGYVLLGLVILTLFAMGTDSIAQTTKTEGFVIDLAAFAPVPGATTKLTRNDNGVAFQIKTKELQPGYAYSVWFTILELDGDVFQFNAGGSPAGGQGQAAFANYVATQLVPFIDGESVVFNLFEVSDGVFGNGEFDDPRNAEIFCIIRCHGPLIPGMQREQFTTFNGGCLLNECDDVQVALFHE